MPTEMPSGNLADVLAREVNAPLPRAEFNQIHVDPQCWERPARLNYRRRETKQEAERHQREKSLARIR